MSKVTQRASFGSRMGAIAASVGSAVGLGNIWRFPYQAGENGGGAYILVYLLCVVLLGIPVIMSEFIIGRSTHKNMKGALRQLSPKSKVHHFAYFCVIGAFVICSFYSVVCGWVIEYLYQAAAGTLDGHTPAEYSQVYNDFVGSPVRGVTWTVLFLVINFAVMLLGVRRGVEGVSRVMMPLLFVILIVFCANSLMLPGSHKGLEFLFSPDFSALGWNGVVDAMGQAFMSLSLGIAALVTYSSYFSDDAPLMKDAVTIASLDTLVALLAGVVIFPAVFSFGFEPTAGPKLVFEVLPSVFYQMPGGYWWAIFFFVLLFFASLTSTISLSEIPITFLTEEFKMSRPLATLLTAVVVMALAALCALSFNVLSGATVAGMNIFSLFDYVGSNVFMLLGGLFTAIYVGWFLHKQVIVDQLAVKGRTSSLAYYYVVMCLRFFAPVAILIILYYYVTA